VLDTDLGTDNKAAVLIHRMDKKPTAHANVQNLGCADRNLRVSEAKAPAGQDSKPFTVVFVMIYSRKY
jgi:hypothetical protein